MHSTLIQQVKCNLSAMLHKQQQIRCNNWVCQCFTLGRYLQIFADSVALLRSDKPLGLNWEKEVESSTGVPLPGSVLEANATRPDRWMLMPHEAAAAIRNGEELGWHATGRR